MAIQEEKTPPSNLLDLTFDAYLDQHMSNQNKHVIDILKKIGNEDLVNLYKTALFCVFHTEVPFRQMLCSHCIRELFNEFTRRNKKMQEKMKEALYSDLMSLQRIRDSQLSLQKVRSSISIDMDNLYNEPLKVTHYLTEHRPSLSQDEVVSRVIKTLNAKETLENTRHINKAHPIIIAETEFIDAINKIEQFILELEKPLLEEKEIIDEILQRAKIQKAPTAGDIKALKNIFSLELISYFFDKLYNHKWYDKLFTNKLLTPKQQELNSGQKFFFWPALFYLQHIVERKETAIAELINVIPLIKYHQLDYAILNGILQLALKFTQKENVLTVYNKLVEVLNNGCTIPSYFGADIWIQFLQKLQEMKCSTEMFNLLEALLTLRIIPAQTFTDTQKEYHPIPRFQNDHGTGENHFYHTLTERSLSLVRTQKDTLFLLKIYCNALQSALQNKALTTNEQKTLNWRVCFRRSAIEDHPQNINTNEPISDVIDMVRDLSAQIMQCNSESIYIKVINLLQKGESDIFKRILLHLARCFPNKLRGYITEILPNKSYFTGTPLSINVHHEYYMLFQQEFKNLPKNKQDIILGYIKNLELKEPKSDKKLLEYRKFEKLYPIHECLPTDWKQYYDGLERKFKDKIEHPEFLHYISSFVGYPTPKTEEELSSMSIEQIINFMNIWKPEDKGIRAPDRSGLSDTFAKDIKKRPQEYIKHLHLFKNVNEPTYISTLLYTLLNINQVSQNFIPICEFIQWTLTKKEEKFEDRESIFEGDRNWDQVYRAAMNIFTNYFHNLTGKETLSNENINSIKDAYRIIQEITLIEDSWLKEQPMSSKEAPIEHYQRAINSLHGDAMTALFQYGMWQNRANLSLNDVSDHLEKVLKVNHYPETYAVIGRHLPWIKSMDEEWFAANLDKLLPENDNAVFDVTWLCYVHFVPPYTDMYDILKKKFIYALNRNYTQKEDNTDNGGTAAHLAMYYGRGTIALEDPIFDILLPQQQETFEGVSLLSYIGRSLRDEANKNLEPIYYERFKNLWGKYRATIAENEQNHKDGLKSFGHWYTSGVFDQKWALNQLHDIVCTHNIIPTTYGLIDQLIVDVDCDALKSIEIVEKLVTQSDRDFLDITITDLENLFNKINEKESADIKAKALTILENIINSKNNLEICSRLEPIVNSLKAKL